MCSRLFDIPIINVHTLNNSLVCNYYLFGANTEIEPRLVYNYVNSLCTVYNAHFSTSEYCGSLQIGLLTTRKAKFKA
jgi:hypothetical protein